MKGTKVKCRDCKYVQGEGKLFWCYLIKSEVKPLLDRMCNGR